MKSKTQPWRAPQPNLRSGTACQAPSTSDYSSALIENMSSEHPTATPATAPKLGSHTPVAAQPPATPTAPSSPSQRVSHLLDALDQAAAEGGNSATERSASQAHQEDYLVSGHLGIATALFAALRHKHRPTAAHSLRVALSASGWATVLEMPEPLRTQFELAALLHDIGKMGVPDEILYKPGRLKEEEVDQIDHHPEWAAEILNHAGAPEAIIHSVVASAAWYDGSHHRVSLAGDDIPIFARMLAIVDAFDAMTTDHVYRPAKSRERALAELFECAGSQFDPALVKSFASQFDRDQNALKTEVAKRWITGVRCEALPWEHNPSTADPNAPHTPAASRESLSEQLFQQKLIDNMQDGVIFVDARSKITLWNTGTERLTGVGSEAAIGQVLRPSLLEMADEQSKVIADENCPVAQSIQTGVQSMQRVTILGRTGRHMEVDLHVVPVRSNEGVRLGATIAIHDASSEASLEERCQALHTEMTKDPMTQVANRAEFDRMLAAFTDAHQETGLPCSLIMADIDHFKKINDTYGHQAGDEAIISFASLLKSMCRSGDLVARYGGEEFAVLCADCNNASATARAEEMRKRLAELPHSELGNKNITASFGVTELQAGDTPETMLRRSDRALLQAKDQGRNQVVQLGEGMADEQEKKSWFSFGSWSNKSLIECALETNVPIEIAIQKLRGFIADHNAKIIKTDEYALRIEATDDGAGRTRRKNDKPVTFVIDVALSQDHEERSNGAGLAAGKYVLTRADVSIRPRRDRDRRKSSTTERARLMLGSLKSYLMAKEASMEGVG